MRNNVAILIGNLLDHYDTTMYVLLAPFIAPLFFPDDDKLIGIIKTHVISLISMIARPLGAAVFGWLADLIDPLKILKYCLIGVSFATFCIGFLPTYSNIGYCAPLLLLILRGLQSFFASGEAIISKLYLISNNPTKHGGIFSSIYALSILFGTLIASGIVELISFTQKPFEYWRMGFIFSFFTGIVAIYIRSSSYVVIKNVEKNYMQKILATSYKAQSFKIAIITGFSYLSYYIPFTMINSLLSSLPDANLQHINRVHSYLIIFDCIIVVLVGYCFRFFKLKDTMIVCALLLTVSEVVLLYKLAFLSTDEILFLRLIVIVLGVIFSVFSNVWLVKTANYYDKNRYFITAIGSSLGIEIIAKSFTTWSLYCFSIYGNFIIPIIYIILLFIGTNYCIYSYPKLEDEI